MTNARNAPFFFLAIYLFLISSIPAAVGQVLKSPNIVLILVDDQRNESLGCYGHPILKTPNIDSLAKSGVRFENAFVTTSICAASRATIFTGLYERTHGYTFGKPPLKKKYTNSSYPAILKAAGYRTGFVGKFGVRTRGKAQKDMFDFFHPIRTNPYIKTLPNGEKRHETEIAVDKAIEFLESGDKDQRFCLSISFNAVHAEDSDKANHYPWPKSVDQMYKDIQIPKPKLSDPKIFDRHPEFLKKSMNRKRYFWRWDKPEKYQKNMRAHFRMISGVDRAVGRLQRKLEQLQLQENTVIIYLADNGYYMGDRGFAGKWTHYEQSLRIPMIIFDPRLKEDLRGQVSKKVVLNLDIPSTIVDLAGKDIPKHYQGESLTPLLEGKGQHWRSDFLCEHLMNHPDLPKWEGVRGERYVYAVYNEQNPPYEYLHDLKQDPDQLINFANDPKYQTILEAKRARVKQLKESLGGKN